MYMSSTRSGRIIGPSKLSVAIYDTPRVVGERLSNALALAGYDVLFDGNLTKETACREADVWLIKWTYGLGDYGFLKDAHPRLGIISATNGVDHINKQAIAELNLRTENCPTFSSIPVAEHAIGLALRSVHGACVLPPLSSSVVVFSEYSDTYAERAVAQMLMRTRQLDRSIERARDGKYRDNDDRRSSEPWFNSELAGARIGIIGHDRDAFELSRILKEGFDCDLYGYDIPEELAGFYRVKPESYLRILEYSDYIFLCTSRYGPTNGPWTIDARQLPAQEDLPLSNSDVAVLGTGAIGSIIARICKKGFNCNVRAFNRSRKPELSGIVEYVDPKAPISIPISDSNFTFVSLPLNEGTSNLITAQQMGGLTLGRKRVLVNVTRDKIVESDAVFDFVSRGALLAYATDVVPNDAALCKGGLPDNTTQKFLQHPFVIPTPHEGECSKNALERLVGEVLIKLNNFMM
jgi:lactate dehydrogenase-like 2-hydroxyacid dehydrogenase